MPQNEREKNREPTFTYYLFLFYNMNMKSRIQFFNIFLFDSSVPAETFEIEKTKPMISTVNVTCRVEGIFPEPQLELFQEDGPHGSRYVLLSMTV